MKIRYALALLAIFLFHMASNYWVFSGGPLAHFYDESCRIRAGADIFFHAGSPADLLELDRLVFKLDSGQAHPHFFEVVEAVSWKLLGGVEAGAVERMILITNAFFLGLLLWGLYGIGSILYDKKTGLLAAFLVSFFPLVFAHSRIAMLDLPLASMVSFSIFLLLKTNRFSSLFYSCLFGIVFGLSELTKEAALLFMAVPLGYYFIGSFLKGKRSEVTANFFMSILFFLLVSGTVYLRMENWPAFGIYSEKISIEQPMPFWYYGSDFYNLVGPWALVLCAPFLVKALVNFKSRKALLFLWFFVPVVFFSFSPNKSMRFLLPVAPAFALIIAREVLDDRSLRLFRRIVLFLLIAVAVVQYGLYHGRFFAGLTKNRSYLDAGMTFVQKDPYRDATTALLDIFRREAVPGSGHGREKNILVLFDLGQIVGTFEVKAFLERLPFRTESSLAVDPVFAKRMYSKRNWEAYVLSGDYLLTRHNEFGGQGASMSELALARQSLKRKLDEAFERHKNSFMLLAQVPVWDGSRIDVYRKIGE